MTIVLLILTLVTFGNPTIQKVDILTSNEWLEVTNNPNHKVIHVFQKNGEYIIKSGTISFTGQWYWTNDDEIFILTNEFKTDSVSYQFPEGLGAMTPGTYVRITLLNTKELKTTIDKLTANYQQVMMLDMQMAIQGAMIEAALGVNN